MLQSRRRSGEAHGQSKDVARLFCNFRYRAVNHPKGAEPLRATRNNFAAVAGGLGSYALAFALFAGGCRSTGESSDRPRRPTDISQADDYIERAVRESAEGLILLDGVNDASGIDYEKLHAANESIRWEAARCFIAFATRSIERSPEGVGEGISGVPSGQIRLRLTLRQEGSVANLRVLQSGFQDEEMNDCVVAAFYKQKFPQNTRAFSWQLDAFYWVSLGFHRSLDLPEFHESVRRKVASASVRASSCLRGRDLPNGRYVVKGMTLANSNGQTMSNRVEIEAPDEVKKCLQMVLRGLEFLPEPDSFARPIFYEFPLDVREGDIVDSPQGEWLRLLELEDAALRAQERELKAPQ